MEAGGIREKIVLDPPYRHYEGPKRIGGLEAKNPHSRGFLTLLSEAQLRIIPKHKLMLKVIDEWLSKKRGFDEFVIQSFSEVSSKRLFHVDVLGAKCGNSVSRPSASTWTPN